MNPQTWAYITKLQFDGMYDPECKMCKEIFLPAILNGKKISAVFAPSHKPSPRCRSGKHPHCTCDTCF